MEVKGMNNISFVLFLFTQISANKTKQCLYRLYFTPYFTGAHITAAISTAMPFTVALVDTRNSYNMGLFFSLISSSKKQNGF